MPTQTTYPLSLNGDTFNGLKTDFDTMLRKLLTEMENHEEDEATITIKVGVKLEKDQTRDLQSNGYDAMRDIVKPTFKHEISTIRQIKDKKTGSLGGSMEMVWDRELCQYVMRPIDNGQVSMFDKQDSKGITHEPPALPGPSGEIIDADFKAIGNSPTEAGGEGESDIQHTNPKVLFEYMKQFVGMEMKVLEHAGQYTVSTSDNQVVLSSMCKPTDRFYCSKEKLSPHVGHVITCIGSPSDEEKFDTISIRCETCDELLFDIDAPADEPEEEADKDKELLDTFNWLLGFNGQSMKVLEAMGNYTVRTESNKVILSSANPQTLLYCSGDILGAHVGHRLVCKASGPVDEYPDTISIICEECDETLFELHSPAWVEEGEDEDPSDDYPYEEPGEEG